MDSEDPAKPLNGQVALITGSRIGIGRQIARELAEAGAAVVLNGSSETGIDELLGEFEEITPKVSFIRADISSKAEVRKLVDTSLDRFGTIDILINNAAVAEGGAMADISAEDWQKIFDINLSGTLFCSQEVIPIMKEKGKGSIVNMSSTAAFDLPRFNGAYCISKACICALTKILAKETAPHGIRVNALAPAYIPTDLSKLDDPEKDEKYRQIVLSKTPLRKFGRPEDVSKAVLFLVSGRSDSITGEVIRISGGLQMP
ncbi:SDR family NAD(P)-dependent oxidoreductase [Thermodesulfobacteriota bacterium]